MYNDDATYQYGVNAPTPDPLDEFLAQLMNDIPDVLPAPITAATPVYASASAPASTSIPASSFPSSSTAVATPGTTIVPYYTPESTPLICQWVSPSDHTLLCGTSLPADPKYACAHLRQAHHIRGNEKVTVQCRWRDCHVAPMQRGSLVRHVLTVHLCLLKWRCDMCGRTFARKGTAHACKEDW